MPETIGRPDLGIHFRIGRGQSNWLLESIFNSKATRIFLDLDTGRVAGLPQKWRDQKDLNIHLDDITAWAAHEGFDMFGTEYVSARDGRHYFSLQSIGLQAWELGKDRWKMTAADVTLQSLQAEGRLAGRWLLRYDPK